jgi:hypothetical protein
MSRTSLYWLNIGIFPFLLFRLLGMFIGIDLSNASMIGGYLVYALFLY